MKKTFALFLSLIIAASAAAPAYAVGDGPNAVVGAYESGTSTDDGSNEPTGPNEKKTYKLTVNYVYEDGSQAAAPYVEEGIEGEDIREITSPVVNGYEPEFDRISVYMNGSDQTATVLYKKKPEDVKYTLTVKFCDENGKELASPHIQTFKPGESYAVTAPEVNGYTPNDPLVSGTMSDNLTLTVTYKKKVEEIPVSGKWVVSNYKVYYMKGNNPTTGSAVIDGKSYQFDGSGALTETGFIDINGNTMYLDGGTVSVGYKIIGGSIYCFDGNGAMIKGAVYDGYSFDISGRIENDNVIVSVNGRSYLILNHAIYQGYYMMGGNIYLFGSDGAMVTNATVDGCTFGYDGVMSSGIYASALTIGRLSDVPFSGEPCRPQVTVSFGGIVLTENVHYTVEYSDNTDPGVATVTVIGMGPVSGSVSTQFNILSNKAKTLTIKYRNKAGMSVASSYETSVEEGQKYKIESPKVDGYVPDKEVVEGVMGSENLEIVVTYRKDGETENEKKPNVKTNEKTIPPSIKYNYKLFFSVFAVSTILVGGSVALIINWDLVKKKISMIKKKRKV